jgi:hypothetical protein
MALTGDGYLAPLSAGTVHAMAATWKDTDEGSKLMLISAGKAAQSLGSIDISSRLGPKNKAVYEDCAVQTTYDHPHSGLRGTGGGEEPSLRDPPPWRRG